MSMGCDSLAAHWFVNGLMECFNMMTDYQAYILSSEYSHE